MTLAKRIRRSGVKLFVAGQSAVALTLTAAPTGTFEQGETVTGGTSSATGVVLYVDLTNDVMYLASVTGTFVDADALTGGTSGATATVDTGGVDATGVFTPFVRFAAPQGQIQLQDQRGVTTIVDFDSTEEDYALKLTDARDGNLSWNSNTILTDPGQLLQGLCFKFNLVARVRRTRTTIDTLDTETREWEGFFSQNSETDQESGISQGNRQLEISAEGPFA